MSIQAPVSCATSWRWRRPSPYRSFDAVIGRYVLHHVELTVVAPMLATILTPLLRSQIWSCAPQLHT